MLRVEIREESQKVFKFKVSLKDGTYFTFDITAETEEAAKTKLIGYLKESLVELGAKE